ncbi:hypothetical protein [Brevibacillus porteri]|uniref:hypothetical protein n=1 Tax=Brevibacillus porteri TaxID=2126350 RepID=UPI00370B86E3
MDLPKNLQDNHSKRDEEGQVIPNIQETKGSGNEERPIESWGQNLPESGRFFSFPVAMLRTNGKPSKQGRLL